MHQLHNWSGAHKRELESPAKIMQLHLLHQQRAGVLAKVHMSLCGAVGCMHSETRIWNQGRECLGCLHAKAEGKKAKNGKEAN